MKLVFSFFTFVYGIFIFGLTKGEKIQSVNGAVLNYEIGTTWDNVSLPNNETTRIFFSEADDTKNVSGLLITVDAPWYNDPLPNASAGRLDGLWDYEVVEVFFLGSNENYIEIELGPGGHYLVYYLEGVRNATHLDWTLNDYRVSVNETSRRWTGEVVIPTEYFPPNVDKFNAYAIHGLDADDSRVYMSLFPVPFNSTDGPDFHNLDPFQPVDLSSLIEIRNQTSTE